LNSRWVRSSWIPWGHAETRGKSGFISCEILAAKATGHRPQARMRAAGGVIRMMRAKNISGV
jgi:hypothetical protein